MPKYHATPGGHITKQVGPISAPMAKRQANKRKSSPSRTASASEIREAKKKICNARRIGQQLIKKCPPRTSEPRLIKAAEKLHTTPALAKRYRVLAMKKKGFTWEQLKKLLGLFDKTKKVLNITHVLHLLKIDDQDRRLALTKKALKNDWSAHRLHQKVLASAGKLRRGGRKYKLPDDKKEMMVFADRGLRSWHGWLAALTDPSQKYLSEKWKKEFRDLKSRVEQLRQSYLETAQERSPL